MKPFYAPLYEQLVKHAASIPTSFHVPGHHNSKTMGILEQADSQLQEIKDRFKSIMEIDVTELSSTDDLHHPEASIKVAQHLAAQCFGSEDTYFLVGGSTSGNLALLLSVCKPGDTIIVQRNVHKSVINGLKLAGAVAIFLTPQFDVTTGLATIPSLGLVEQALLQYPDAKAVFLTNPNYYGISMKLDPYVEVVHRNDIPLLIDEAHGAHYGFHPKLPKSALAAGADAVVQSTHKTLPALTMGAMLHIQGNRIKRSSISQSLAMIQSSSPSFPIMASLDVARAMIQAMGMDLFQTCLDEVHSFRRWVNDGEMIIQTVTWNEESEESSLRQLDPLRVLLYDRSGQLSGYDLLKALEQIGCWAEMADLRYVVLVMGIHTTSEEIGLLQEAISSIHHTYKHDNSNMKSKAKGLESTGLRFELGKEAEILNPVSFSREIVGESEMVSLKLRQCEGLQSAEMIVPYPPGIPLLYPGERITADVINQIEKLASAGAKFQGAEDADLNTIKVVIDQKKV